jgi:predicted Mrr-cat superfamily restriction endonuclease
MTNYWVIPPYDSKNEFLYEGAWQYCLENKTISVGHTVKEDLSSLPRVAFRSVCDKAYCEKTKAVQTKKFNMLWQFYNEIKIGDLITARKGLSAISGVGTVTRLAYYEYGMNKNTVSEGIDFHHHLGVDWHQEYRNVHVKNREFVIGAFLQQISKSKYLSFFDPN